jgi:hypothetical protein
MLQDAFRRIGIHPTSEGVAEVRAILRELPSGHFAQQYVGAATELKSDAAVVDTFLHPQDRAYTVPQLLELVQTAGLQFQNWGDNYPYWRNAVWGPGTAVAVAVEPLPPQEHWAVVELLRQEVGLHTFTVRQTGVGVVGVNFDTGDWQRFVPLAAPGLSRRGPGLFTRGAYEYRCSQLEQFVLDGVDGIRTIKQIIDVPALEEIPAGEREMFAQRFFEHLWKLGHVMITLP